MIFLPPINKSNATRSILSAFGGLDHRLVISEGNFYTENNLTSDEFPVMANIKEHGTYKTFDAPVTAITVNNKLWYIQDGKLRERYGTGTTENVYDIGLIKENHPGIPINHTIVNMGAYLIIFPDAVYFNTQTRTDFGSLSNKTESTGLDSTVYVTDESGAIPIEKSDTPSIGDLSIDKDEEGNDTLVRYNGEGWSKVTTTFVRIKYAGAGNGFSTGEAVTVSGVSFDSKAYEELNSTHPIVAVGSDFVAFKVKTEDIFPYLTNATITISRDIPMMTLACVAGNRLWGCYRGASEHGGKPINEIYASKLGDFKTFNYFQGTAADSYALSLGSDGLFTGCIAYQDTPMFFKEKYIHQIVGSYPENFSLQTIECSGSKSSNSISVIDSTVFYLGRDGVNVFSGGFPQLISSALGNGVFNDGVGHSHNKKYYINMADADGVYSTYVYDIAKGVWHKQDEGTKVSGFASLGDEIYYIVGNDIKTMFGSEMPNSKKLRWYAETGLIGTDSPDTKYLSRLTIRMSLALEATVMISVQYDSLPEWIPIANLSGTSLASFALPIKLDRCDHLRLRFDGIGDCRIFSIAKTIEPGGTA